jgi:dTDP-4-dehydrorhamnose 3,5-epimerase
MQFERLAVPEVVLVTPKRFADDRGYFSEVFKAEWFRKEIEDVGFVQDNQSLSRQVGTIRGLHFQTAPFAQGKLVRCLKGSILDVAVDIRVGSPTFGKWAGATLTAAGGKQLWVPVGFAHGFCTLEPDTEVFYKVTAGYSQANDRGLAFDDPAIGIVWPVASEAATLSDKDRKQPRLADLPASFTY